MSRKKNAVAAPERPRGGGSFTRDPKTGKLKRVEHTKPAEVVANRMPAEPLPEGDPVSPTAPLPEGGKSNTEEA